jgi:hypothetical protein
LLRACLESLNEKVKEKGVAILKGQRLKLQDRLSDIGPGFLFDRTDRALLKKRENGLLLFIVLYIKLVASNANTC